MMARFEIVSLKQFRLAMTAFDFAVSQSFSTIAPSVLDFMVSTIKFYYRKCIHPTAVLGHSKKVSVVVIDGVTVGHPCCGVAKCKIPLENNHHRFCPTHKQQNDVCSVVGCNNPVAVAGRKTCTIPEHQEAEEYHNTRGQARFQLKKRLEKARIVNPDDAVGIEAASVSELLGDDDHEDVKTKISAKFGRSRTHNEQLFVTPCGIIVARETFYHAEALYSVIVCGSLLFLSKSTNNIQIIQEMIKRTYRIPGTMPEHIFFDNNCKIAAIVANDPVFKNVGLTVDVFHFKCKHSKQDIFCQNNCNPAAYPELLGEGNKHWYFNSSIAEQTNAWLGGYQAICREMRVDRYNFFLDEMVRRRNLMTIEKLQKEGCRPSTWPYPVSESRNKIST